MKLNWFEKSELDKLGGEIAAFHRVKQMQGKCLRSLDSTIHESFTEDTSCRHRDTFHRGDTSHEGKCSHGPDQAHTIHYFATPLEELVDIVVYM